MKLLIFTKYQEKGASSRVRCFQYFPELKKAGFIITSQALINDNVLEKKYLSKGKLYQTLSILYSYIKRMMFALNECKKHDIVFIQKEFMPFIPFWIEKIILKNAKFKVLDIDDAEHLKYTNSKNIITSLLLRKKFNNIASDYHTVIVGNEWLKKNFLKWNPSLQTIKIPSTINHLDYQNEGITHPNKQSILIGWVGTPVTQKYLNDIIPAIQKIRDEFSDRNIKLIAIGASRTFSTHNFIETAEWSQQTEGELISTFDIGIMPLKNSEWDEGKCSYKAIQYMAAGIPVVLSSTLANKDVCKNGVNALFADSQDEWYAALKELIVKKSLRENIGKNNKHRSIEYYSIQSQAPILINTLKSLIYLCQK